MKILSANFGITLALADHFDHLCVCLFDILGVQLVLAGSEGGLIILWDLRGGRNAAAFVTAGEVSEVLQVLTQKLVIYVWHKIVEEICCNPRIKTQTNLRNLEFGLSE